MFKQNLVKLMTEWKREIIWPCHLDKAIFQVILEPTENPSIIESMKDVKSCTVIHKYWKNEVYTSEMDIRMDPPVPNSLKFLLNSKQLGWIQHAKWTPKTGEFDVRVVPHILPGLIQVQKISKFVSLGIEKAHQSISLKAKCDIPIVGRLFEGFILHKLMDSIHEKFAEVN